MSDHEGEGDDPMSDLPPPLGEAGLARLRRAWRATCPDITDRELVALSRVRLSGPTTKTALAAFRAGVEEGRLRAQL